MSGHNIIIKILYYKNDRNMVDRLADSAVHVRNRRAGRKNHQFRFAEGLGYFTTLS